MCVSQVWGQAVMWQAASHGLSELMKEEATHGYRLVKLSACAIRSPIRPFDNRHNFVSTSAGSE